MTDTIETLPVVEDTQAPLVPTMEEVEVVGFVQDKPEEEVVDATEVAPLPAF